MVLTRTITTSEPPISDQGSELFELKTLSKKLDHAVPFFKEVILFLPVN